MPGVAGKAWQSQGSNGPCLGKSHLFRVAGESPVRPRKGMSSSGGFLAAGGHLADPTPSPQTLQSPPLSEMASSWEGGCLCLWVPGEAPCSEVPSFGPKQEHPQAVKVDITNATDP